MHEETVRFLQEAATRFATDLAGNVLEFGSYNINGQAREHLPPTTTYTGVDWREGPGVEIVGLFDSPWCPSVRKPYDAFVCVNAFEHDPHWKASLRKAVRMTRLGAPFVLSVPNETYEAHEVTCAPDRQHYAGVPASVLQEELAMLGVAGGERAEAKETFFLGRNASTVARCYDRALHPSDINEHVPTLWWYASQCRSVREFGVRSGVSTSALVAGCDNVESFDIEDPSADHLKALRRWGWKFERKSSLDVEPAEVDMLFIDSLHEGEHLWLELVRHESRVRRWIVMHDTETFGVRGDCGGDGLQVAIRRIIERGQWKQREHFKNNNGLTVLERVSA